MSISLRDLVVNAGLPAELAAKLGEASSVFSGTHFEGTVSVTTQVRGLAELGDALDKFPDALKGKILLDAVTQATEAFRQRAEELAPYDAHERAGREGDMHLQDGIRKRIKVNPHGVHGRVGLVKDVFYGRFIEFGWRAPSGKQVMAEPFMRPAFDEEKYRALAIVSQRLSGGIAAAAAEARRR